jgi:hypothetical protein
MPIAPVRRTGVTLVEVLVAIFLMGVGMLALLTLFPVGAISMARALKDDRCATAAANADAVATAQDLRHDPLVAAAYLNPFPGSAAPAKSPVAAWSGPSYGVFVDPLGAAVFPSTVGALAGVTPGIPRTSMSLSNGPARGGTVLSPAEATRWCSLLDDVLFQADGTPDPSAGGVQRYGQYTWAWLLRQTRAGDPTVVEASVIVYRGRSVDLVNGETTGAASGTLGSNTVTVTGTGLNLRTGTWILDTTPASNGAVPGYFYRVVDWFVDTANDQTVLELESSLRANVSLVTLLDNVAEVFDRGTGP